MKHDRPFLAVLALARALREAVLRWGGRVGAG